MRGGMLRAQILQEGEALLGCKAQKLSHESPGEQTLLQVLPTGLG